MFEISESTITVLAWYGGYTLIIIGFISFMLYQENKLWKLANRKKK